MRRHHGAPVALLLLLCIHAGREAEAAGGGGFVRAQGTRFVVNGSPYYANGFNAYWLMTMAADPAQKGKVTSALSQAAGRGLTVARTWAFSDGGSNALQYSPGKYNENTFKGLDFVLSEARKYGVKVILGLVNNYETFGGKKQYVDWARGQGQAIGSDDEFFTNSVVKGFYKNHIKGLKRKSANYRKVLQKIKNTVQPSCKVELVFLLGAVGGAPPLQLSLTLEQELPRADGKSPIVGRRSKPTPSESADLALNPPSSCTKVVDAGSAVPRPPTKGKPRTTTPESCERGRGRRSSPELREAPPTKKKPSTCKNTTSSAPSSMATPAGHPLTPT